MGKYIHVYHTAITKVLRSCGQLLSRSLPHALGKALVLQPVSSSLSCVILHGCLLLSLPYLLLIVAAFKQLLFLYCIPFIHFSEQRTVWSALLHTGAWWPGFVFDNPSVSAIPDLQVRVGTWHVVFSGVERSAKGDIGNTHLAIEQREPGNVTSIPTETAFTAAG